MKGQFTPGEWFHSHREIPNDEDGMFSTQVYTEDGQTIADIAWYKKHPVKEIINGKPMITTKTYRDANAQLISASPDLFSACVKALAMCEDVVMPSEKRLDEMAKTIREALEKAVG